MRYSERRGALPPSDLAVCYCDLGVERWSNEASGRSDGPAGVTAGSLVLGQQGPPRKLSRLHIAIPCFAGCKPAERSSTFNPHAESRAQPAGAISNPVMAAVVSRVRPNTGAAAFVPSSSKWRRPYAMANACSCCGREPQRAGGRDSSCGSCRVRWWLPLPISLQTGGDLGGVVGSSSVTKT